MDRNRQHSPCDTETFPVPNGAAARVPRITSRDVLGSSREVEIDHEGRIYRLRLTQLNKLILTM